MDSWGEDLICNIRDDIIVYWQRSTGFSSRAIDLADIVGGSDVPTVTRQVIMAGSARHLIALGCNPIGETDQDKLEIRWCSREDLADWTPSSSNTAGEYRLASGSEIIKAATARGEIIIWTDAAVWSMQYVGGADIFGFTQLATKATLLAPNLHVYANNMLFWMSNSGFYAYDGAVRPLPCPVQQHIFDNLNFSQIRKCFACSNSRVHEIWFFYVSLEDDPTNEEISHYAIYNWLDNTWSVGALSRTSWIEPSFSQYPVAGTPDPDLFFQENGWVDEDGMPLNSFIESADLDISDGQHIVMVNRAIPDVKWLEYDSNSALKMDLKSKAFPSETSYTTTTATFTPTTTEQWVRARGRQVRIRYYPFFVGTGATAFQLGAMRLDVQMDGMQ
jgi:hypothetical protein